MGSTSIDCGKPASCQEAGADQENFIDMNDSRPAPPQPPSGESTLDSGDWRTTLQPDSRQRIVNKIVETLKRHLPFSGEEGLNEIRKIAAMFEQKVFTAASSQSDYLRRISLKMLTLETKSQNTMPNPGNNSKPPFPASSDSTVQTGLANGGDWQEEVYQKIKAMKETYLPQINAMHRKVSAKLLQHDSLPQQLKPEQLDKLKLFKTILERYVHFLTSSKGSMVPAYKEKISLYEEQMINLMNTIRPSKPVSALQQGHLPPPHMHSMHQPQPQPQPQINQTKSHDNQMNPQLQSINLQGSMPTMQLNMTNLQHNSSSSLPGVSTALQHQLDISCLLIINHQQGTYEQAGSEFPAPDSAGNGMSTMSIPHVSTDFGKPNIAEKPHDHMVNKAKPNALRSTVVTIVDEASTAVCEDLAAMRKQGLCARNFFTQTGMGGAFKIRCYLSALVILALIICFLFNLNHQY